MAKQVPLVINTTTPTQQLPAGDTLDAVALVRVAKAGTTIGSRTRINFIEGANVTITATDDAGADEVDVTIAASGGGGGSPSVITVAQLTADSDNLAPSGIENVTVLRMSSDNGLRAVTSISSTSMADGHEFTLVNVGTHPLILQAQHPDATSGNAFLAPIDVFLPGGQAIGIVRDSTSGGFYLNGAPAQTGRIFRVGSVAGSPTAGDWGTINLSVGGGSISTAPADGNGPGHWGLSTGASATANPGIAAFKSSSLGRIADAYTYSRGVVRIPTLSDGTQTFTVIVGISNNTNVSGTSANTVAIEYTDATNGGRWFGYSRAGGTTTTVDLGVTVAANTLYVLEVFVNKQGTEARFFVDGVYRGRSITDLPAAGVAFPVACIAKSVGTTARTLLLSEISGTYVY